MFLHSETKQNAPVASGSGIVHRTPPPVTNVIESSPIVPETPRVPVRVSRGGFLTYFNLEAKQNTPFTFRTPGVDSTPPHPPTPEQTLVSLSRATLEALDASISAPLSQINTAIDSVSCSPTPSFTPPLASAIIPAVSGKGSDGNNDADSVTESEDSRDAAAFLANTAGATPISCPPVITPITPTLASPPSGSRNHADKASGSATGSGSLGGAVAPTRKKPGPFPWM